MVRFIEVFLLNPYLGNLVQSLGRQNGVKLVALPDDLLEVQQGIAAVAHPLQSFGLMEVRFTKSHYIRGVGLGRLTQQSEIVQCALAVLHLHVQEATFH